MNRKNALFSNKTVLITGGTGFFGQAFAKNLLEFESIKKIIIFSRDEWKQWQMHEDTPLFRKKEIRYFLGDVRDKERLLTAFQDVDLIVHAAALKQVPAAEYNPSEFIKTNILGTMNVIDAAINRGVKKVIMLSTDKAVNPVNLYGATKLCAEKAMVAGKSYVGKQGHPFFSVVRYGNVLGSRGSLLPHWQTLVDQGKKILPVTDAHMTRFWITLDQAVQFVKEIFSIMEGGEIFIPKLPSMRVVDLLKAFAPDCTHEIIGIRPGEKVHELLISQDDAERTYEFANHYTIAPFFATFDQEGYSMKEQPRAGKRIAHNFSLTSNTNPLFTDSIEEIKKLCKSA